MMAVFSIIRSNWYALRRLMPTANNMERLDLDLPSCTGQTWFDQLIFLSHVSSECCTFRANVEAAALSGTPVGDLCRQLGVSDATFYAWKKKYAHLGVSELRRLRQLEEENSRLKRLVADLSLDKHMLSEALRKKV